LGDVRPISVFTVPFFGSVLVFAGAALGPSDASATPALTLVTDESSSTGFAAAGFPAFAASTSSGMVAAGTHSVIPGRHTSVVRGRTLLASAERSSSVRTSR
jgi:hypothetical protein